MHIGLIPDGHRRYARENEISNRRSYLEGQSLINQLTSQYTALGSLLGKPEEEIESVTVYLLSKANLKRDDEELELLYDVMDEYLTYALEEDETDVSTAFREQVVEKGTMLDSDEVNLNFVITYPEAIPDFLLEKIEQVEQKYDGSEITVNFLTSYNGREEIVQAVSKSEYPTVQNVEDNLYIDHEIDFVVRTGDNPTRECLSGFPIWQSSYSEYYHIKKNFPAVTVSDLEMALEHYTSLRRNKGE